jgi:hypothetical protein
MFGDDHGVCLHWPSRSSLFKAGMLENGRSCCATFVDLRRKDDCPFEKKGLICGNFHKRSRTASLSSKSSSLESGSLLTESKTSKSANRMHTHTHTHTHEQDDGTKIIFVCTKEIAISTTCSSSSSHSTSSSSAKLHAQ